MKPVLYVKDDDTYVFECPHCDMMIQVLKKDVRCQIFRHGVLKKGGKQIGPHTSKDECDRLKQADLIYGCGKPFRMNKRNKECVSVDVCDYI